MCGDGRCSKKEIVKGLKNCLEPTLPSQSETCFSLGSSSHRRDAETQSARPEEPHQLGFHRFHGNVVTFSLLFWSFCFFGLFAYLVFSLFWLIRK